MSRSEDVRPLSRWITQSKESRKSAVCVWFSIPGHGNSTAQTPQRRGWEMSWPASRSLWLSLCVEKKITFRRPLCPATYEPTESGSCKLFPCQPLPSSFLTVFLPSISDVRMQLFLSAMRTGALPARLWLYSIPSSSPPWDSDHLT